MARQITVKNYNNFSQGVVTDFNLLAGSPENAVRDALNFEFTATDGAQRRKAIDLEAGFVTANPYIQNNSALPLGVAKLQSFTLKNSLDQFTTPSKDITFTTFEGKGLVHELGAAPTMADAVLDPDVTGTFVPDSFSWTHVAWSPKLGLLAGVTTDPFFPIMISSDGIRWSAAPKYTAPISGSIGVITWSSTLEVFIAKGSGSTMISDNGTTWQVYAYNPLEVWEGIAWAPELGTGVTVGSFVNSVVQTTTDGINWTPQVIQPNSWTDVVWARGLGLFVAISTVNGSTGQLVATSIDGVTWIARNTPTDRIWRSISWSEDRGVLVVVGSTDFVMTSSDGINWSESQVATENAQWQGITRSETLDLFVAVAASGTGRVMTSPDGVTWSAIQVPTNAWSAVDWSEEIGIFSAVASNGTGRTMISKDGLVWSSQAASPISNADPADWVTVRGVNIGTLGAEQLGVLYNTTPTNYNLTTTLGLGKGATIRDFTGVDDGLEVDEKPALRVFNHTPLGLGNAWTAGETLLVTGGSPVTTRRFRVVDPTPTALDRVAVDKELGDIETDFDGSDTTDYIGFTITGVLSGYSEVITTQIGKGLSDAHRYNLVNQGWDQDKMDTYALDTGFWPSNSQVWFSGKDSSGDFSPAELDKVASGNSQAAKGHILLNPFRSWRHAQVPGVWIGAVPPTTFDRGFTTLASYGSRIAMSGAAINGDENSVYISRILLDRIVPSDAAELNDLDFTEVFSFYQRNDPTAEISNELLPDDGVVIPITEAGRIHKLVTVANNLLVIADNGVWAITGLDLSSGFQTDSFSVYKVTGASGSTHSRTVVSTSNTLYYWAADGIYAVSVDNGKVVAANVTINRISNLYKGISPEVRDSATAYHDEFNHKVLWAYNSSNSSTTPELRNKILVLDLRLNTFYPYQVPATLLDSQGNLGGFNMSITGFTQDKAAPLSSGEIPLKLVMAQADIIDVTTGTTDIRHIIMEFNNASSDPLVIFDDYSNWRRVKYLATDLGVDTPTFIEPWPDTLGDTTRDKQAVWAFVFMKKTETGWFEDNPIVDGPGGGPAVPSPTFDPLASLAGSAPWDILSSSMSVDSLGIQGDGNDFSYSAEISSPVTPKPAANGTTTIVIEIGPGVPSGQFDWSIGQFQAWDAAGRLVYAPIGDLELGTGIWNLTLTAPAAPDGFNQITKLDFIQNFNSFPVKIVNIF